MKGLCALKKERKEKVHSFTQRFAAYLKNFSETDKPSDKVLIEYYTSALGPDLAMFAKGRAKPTLTETYEEAEVVEAKRESIEYYPEQSGEKGTGRKALLFTKPKEEKSPDLENMAKMMQKLSNKIIDMEKEKEAQKFYKPYYKKREDNHQSQPPPHNTASMNLTEVGLDNFCTFHQQPHSEKNCPQWINSMTLVMNQLLDSRLTEEGN